MTSYWRGDESPEEGLTHLENLMDIEWDPNAWEERKGRVKQVIDAFGRMGDSPEPSSLTTRINDATSGQIINLVFDFTILRAATDS